MYITSVTPSCQLISSGSRPFFEAAPANVAMPLQLRTTTTTSADQQTTGVQTLTWVDGRRAALVFEDDELYPLVTGQTPAESIEPPVFDHHSTITQRQPVSLWRVVFLALSLLLGPPIVLRLVPPKIWRTLIALPFGVCDVALHSVVPILPLTLPLLLVFTLPGTVRHTLLGALLSVAQVPLSVAVQLARFVDALVRAPSPVSVQ